MCTARLFSQRVDLFALKIDLDGSSPINHSWRQKTRDTGLPDGEDHIPLRSLVLTQYRSVMDGQTDGFAVAYTALTKIALRHEEKTATGHQSCSHKMTCEVKLCQHQYASVYSISCYNFIFNIHFNAAPLAGIVLLSTQFLSNGFVFWAHIIIISVLIIPAHKI